MQDFERKIIERFFLGYFDMDWLDDYGTEDAVIAQYKEDSDSPSKDKRLAELLTAFAESFQDDKLLGTELTRMLCFRKLPAGTSNAAWLKGIAKKIAGND